jgi:hypothetical protein
MPDELAWSVRLLATTGIHVSLLRVDLPGSPPALALDVARRAFGGDGIYGWLEDGTAAVLLINSPEDTEAADGLALALLRRSAESLGIGGRMEVSAYHAFADQVADADDALLNLSLMPRRSLDLVPGGDAGSAAA